MVRFVLLFLCFTSSAQADTLVATTVIRSGTLLTSAHLALRGGDIAGSLSRKEQAIGKEARVNLYPNRPIRAADLGAPSVVQRNELITLLYRLPGLEIKAEGRALGVAGIGETLRVMNQTSRKVVQGRVIASGVIEVN